MDHGIPARQDCSHQPEDGEVLPKGVQTINNPLGVGPSPPVVLCRKVDHYLTELRVTTAMEELGNHGSRVGAYTAGNGAGELQSVACLPTQPRL
jgi:hypothetical protein